MNESRFNPELGASSEPIKEDYGSRLRSLKKELAEKGFSKIRVTPDKENSGGLDVHAVNTKTGEEANIKLAGEEKRRGKMKVSAEMLRTTSPHDIYNAVMEIKAAGKVTPQLVRDKLGVSPTLLYLLTIKGHPYNEAYRAAWQGRPFPEELEESEEDE